MGLQEYRQTKGPIGTIEIVLVSQTKTTCFIFGVAQDIHYAERVLRHAG